jgi:hypothetical protein
MLTSRTELACYAEPCGSRYAINVAARACAAHVRCVRIVAPGANLSRAERAIMAGTDSRAYADLQAHLLSLHASASAPGAVATDIETVLGRHCRCDGRSASAAASGCQAKAGARRANQPVNQ